MRSCPQRGSADNRIRAQTIAPSHPRPPPRSTPAQQGVILFYPFSPWAQSTKRRKPGSTQAAGRPDCLAGTARFTVFVSMAEIIRPAAGPFCRRTGGSPCPDQHGLETIRRSRTRRGKFTMSSPFRHDPGRGVSDPVKIGATFRDWAQRPLRSAANQPGRATSAAGASAEKGWCPRRDSNSHTLRRRILNPLRLPFRHSGHRLSV